jgi:hypothetical protein
MLRGSGRGTGGTVTRPAPSAPRLDCEVLLRVLRTETEERTEPVRAERERPESERDEPREVLLEVLCEVCPDRPEACAGTLPDPAADPDPTPDPAAVTGAGASPHSVQ